MHTYFWDNTLAFPVGGECDYLDRILSGDPETVEAAICFLEVRPYFFRSGYMFKDILRKCNRAPMSAEQAERFAAFKEKYKEWKKASGMKARRGAAVRRDLSPLLLRLYALFPMRPFRLADGKVDGLVTVGDLHVLICNALKIDPSNSPGTLKGVVRQPRQYSTPPKDPDYWPKYRAWREFPWTPEDVWATLVATIVDVYKLDPAFIVEPQTVLRQPKPE